MASDTRRTIADVVRIISHLGGPECSEQDLSWAADIPAGKQLLEWLASQSSDAAELRDAGGVAKCLDHAENANPLVHQTILGPVALYQEEREMLGRLREHGAEEPAGSRSSRQPASYALPSTLRTRAEVLEREADLLEARAARMKHRSSLAKSATKEAKQTTSAVRKQIEHADQSVQKHQERLADLSVEVDGTVAKSTQQALSLLHTSEKQEDRLATLKAEIASLDRARNAVASSARRLYRDIDDGYSSLPPADELENDSAVVHAQLATITAKGSVGVPKLVDAAFIEALEAIAGQLEASSSGDSKTLSGLLRPQDPLRDLGEPERSSVFPNAKKELEHAGRMDRLLLLQAEERALDIALRDMQESVLPRLQRTHELLNTRGAFAAETEAIVSALIEELEDVNDTIESTKQQGGSTEAKAGEDLEDVLQAAVTDLLKTLLRSDTGGRPTVLLDRADVEAELASLAERLLASHRSEGKWASELKGRIAELSSSCAPQIAAAYEHAPMNTSAPFSAPPGETAAKEGTRGKASELTEAASRLQKESELSSRDKRKLAAFVEKWASK